MRVVARTVMLAVALGAPMAGCAGSSTHETTPVVMVGPSEMVMRDIRRNAAGHLRCQTPNVGVQVESWAGSAGNVIAAGCGYQVTYYVTCETSAFCRFSVQ